jgi:hypothetical protein
MIAVSGDDLIARLDRHLHADDDRLLTDVEVAKTADQSHAVELPRLFLEPADEKHLAIGMKLLLLAELRHLRRRLDGCPAHGGRLSRWFVAGNGHFSPRVGGSTSVRRPSPIAEIAARRKRMGTGAPASFAAANR